MRFKLTLELQQRVMGNKIPINYQYPLQSVIYKMLAKSDENYSAWLHDNGYQSDGKRFKLFTFSNLVIPQYVIEKKNGRMVIKSPVITLFLSFLPEKSTQHFIKGIFQDQIIQIADHISGAQFKVREIKVMKPLEDYHPLMIFRTMSPICVSLKNDRGKMDYLRPDHPKYEEGLLTGLLTRYRVINGKDFEGLRYCHIKVLNESKSVLITIKEGRPEETRVRGYRYRFQIDLPEPLMQIAYESGLGEKGSIGFGMIEIINK